MTITQQGRDALAALASWGRVQQRLTAAMGTDAADGLRRLAGSRAARVSAETSSRAATQEPEGLP